MNNMISQKYFNYVTLNLHCTGLFFKKCLTKVLLVFGHFLLLKVLVRHYLFMIPKVISFVKIYEKNL